MMPDNLFPQKMKKTILKKAQDKSLHLHFTKKKNQNKKQKVANKQKTLTHFSSCHLQQSKTVSIFTTVRLPLFHFIQPKVN